MIPQVKANWASHSFFHDGKHSYPMNERQKFSHGRDRRIPNRDPRSSWYVLLPYTMRLDDLAQAWDILARKPS